MENVGGMEEANVRLLSGGDVKVRGDRSWEVGCAEDGWAGHC